MPELSPTSGTTNTPTTDHPDQGAPWQGCRCPADQAELFTRCGGAEEPVTPHPTLGGVEALYRAWCRTCGREYLGHWRRTRPEPRVAPNWPAPAVRQQPLW